MQALYKPYITGSRIILIPSMPGCSAVGCKNRSEGGYLMKIFPTDPERRAEWTSHVNRDSWMPTKNSFLCEIHFDDHQWEKHRADGKRKLAQFAVPTLFTTFSKLPSSCRLKVSNRSSGKRAIRDAVEHGYSLSFMADVSYKPDDDDNNLAKVISRPRTRAKSVTVDHGYSRKIKDEPFDDHAASDLVSVYNVQAPRKKTIVARQEGIPNSQTLVKSVTVDHGYSRKIKAKPFEDNADSDLDADFNVQTPRKKALVAKHEDNPSSQTHVKSATVDHGYSRKVKDEPFEDHVTSELIITNVRTVETDPYKFVPNITLQPNNVSLVERVAILEKKVIDYANLIRKLRRKSREAIVLKSKTRLRSLNAESGLRTFLNDDQIASLSRKSTKGQAWSDATINRAFQLKLACGSAGYKEILRQRFPFPSLRTLRRNLQQNPIEGSALNIAEVKGTCPD